MKQQTGYWIFVTFLLSLVYFGLKWWSRTRIGWDWMNYLAEFIIIWFLASVMAELTYLRKLLEGV